jgi:hypothetical protein
MFHKSVCEAHTANSAQFTRESDLNDRMMLCESCLCMCAKRKSIKIQKLPHTAHTAHALHQLSGEVLDTLSSGLWQLMKQVDKDGNHLCYLVTVPEVQRSSLFISAASMKRRENQWQTFVMMVMDFLQQVPSFSPVLCVRCAVIFEFWWICASRTCTNNIRTSFDCSNTFPL